MREQFEITTAAPLTVSRDSERVRYSLTDGDTIVSISTDDPTNTENLRVTKYNSASVTITITVDHDDIEYKDIQP